MKLCGAHYVELMQSLSSHGVMKYSAQDDDEAASRKQDAMLTGHSPENFDPLAVAEQMTYLIGITKYGMHAERDVCPACAHDDILDEAAAQTASRCEELGLT